MPIERSGNIFLLGHDAMYFCKRDNFTHDIYENVSPYDTS